MTAPHPRRTRRSAPRAAIIAAFLLIGSGAREPTHPPARAATTPLSGLHVQGNQLVTAQGHHVILRGVNRSGTEYACMQGTGIFDGPSDAASIRAMTGWRINAVNIGLNEECWLGLNGVSARDGGPAYQHAIVAYTHVLESFGIYPLISLFWEAPGTRQATDQTAMPDADHATALWRSVATTFKGDPAVVLRPKEEPFPAGNADTPAAWRCWRDGGSACSEGYRVVGMQSLITTIRATGAPNVIQLSGIQHANQMDQFLAYTPADPLHDIMAAVDVYPDVNPCGTVACYNREYAPIMARMPFMAGEFGESADGHICAVTNATIFMNWMDQHHAGYLAWTWDTWGTRCGDLSLITDYQGTPHAPNGTNYRAHLLRLVTGVQSARRARLAHADRASRARPPCGLRQYIRQQQRAPDRCMCIIDAIGAHHVRRRANGSRKRSGWLVSDSLADSAGVAVYGKGGRPRGAMRP